MEISFEGKELRTLCESKNRAKRRLGDDTASKLQLRLADMVVFSTVGDIISSQLFKLDIDDADHITVELDKNSNIIFCANHNKIPLLENGRVDWTKVTRIKILEIGKNNG